MGVFSVLGVLSGLYLINAVVGDDYCMDEASDAWDCFDVSDDCVWAEPTDNANYTGCGLCLNLTLYANHSADTCMNGETVAKDYGGWYSRCNMNQTSANMTEACFTDDDDSDYDVCEEYEYASECVNSEDGCIWGDVDDYGCGWCIEETSFMYLTGNNCSNGDSFVYNRTNFTAYCDNSSISDASMIGCELSVEVCSSMETGGDCVNSEYECYWGGFDGLGCGVCLSPFLLYHVSGDSECYDGNSFMFDTSDSDDSSNDDSSNDDSSNDDSGSINITVTTYCSNSTIGDYRDDESCDFNSSCEYIGDSNECVTGEDDCLWLSYTDLGCGYCIGEFTLWYYTGSECQDGGNVTLSFDDIDVHGRTYCSNDTVGDAQWTTGCDFDGNDTDVCGEYEDSGDCVGSDEATCYWAELEYGCGVCIGSSTLWYISGSSTCVDGGEYTVADDSGDDDDFSVTTWCSSDTVDGATYNSACDFDDDDDPCEEYENGSDCFEDSDEECAWVTIEDYECGVCVSSNTVAFISGSDCSSGESFTYEGMDYVSYCDIDSLDDTDYTTSCDSSGNEPWCNNNTATTAGECFDEGSECYWAEPFSYNETMYMDCGICVNLTAWWNGTDTTCVTGDVIAQAHGGWVLKCEEDDVTTDWDEHCFMNVTDSDSNSNDDGGEDGTHSDAFCVVCKPYAIGITIMVAMVSMVYLF